MNVDSTSTTSLATREALERYREQAVPGLGHPGQLLGDRPGCTGRRHGDHSCHRVVECSMLDELDPDDGET